MWSYKTYVGIAVVSLAAQAVGAFIGPHGPAHELFALAMGTGLGFCIGAIWARIAAS